MVPQDNFTIVAEVRSGCLDKLRCALAGMNLRGLRGTANPANTLVPFENFKTIHFARFVVLADHAADDRALYDSRPASEEPVYPTYLCFMVDCDGSADALLSHMADSCPGLSEIFGFCNGFNNNGDIKQWLSAHRVRPSASYVNWVGRSVEQVRQEACLQKRLREALPGTTQCDPQLLRAELRAAVGCPSLLAPLPAAPLAWRIANLAHALLPFVVLAASAWLFPRATIGVIGIAAVVFLVLLRWHELSDPRVPNPRDDEWASGLRESEDYDVSNQYTAMGSIKPGPFRLVVQIVILYAINWTARHIFTRGGLARIGTIHFAHWVALDRYQRGFFCSNYDGGHEAYMDDFINKAGFGLNLSFSGYIAYPPTDWLLAKGAWREKEFKHFQRRHQIPTDVWYKAYPGLTARDLARNSRIRNGFRKEKMSDDEIRRWLAEI